MRSATYLIVPSPLIIEEGIFISSENKVNNSSNLAISASYYWTSLSFFSLSMSSSLGASGSSSSPPSGGFKEGHSSSGRPSLIAFYLASSLSFCLYSLSLRIREL